MLDLESEALETAEDIVALAFEMVLKCFHLVSNLGRLEHGDGGFLEGHVGSAVKVGPAAADGADEFFGTDDPCHTLRGG